MPNKENNALKKKAFLFIKIVVSISLILYLATRVDFSSIAKLGLDVTFYIVISALIMLAALSFMTIRWKYVLNIIEHKNYEWVSLFLFYLVGSFFNIFIPGAIGGDAMRLYYVSKVYHLTKKRALLSVFIERIAGLFALGIILMFSLLFNETIRTKLDFGFGLILLSTIGILVTLALAKFIIRKKFPLTYTNMAVILFLSGLGQFGDILIAYIFSLYFDLHITILNLMAIMPLVYVATVVPISLGGVGVREGVMTAGMALYGVDVSDAVMVSFLLYFVKIVIGIIGWLIYIRLDKYIK